MNADYAQRSKAHRSSVRSHLFRSQRTDDPRSRHTARSPHFVTSEMWKTRSTDGSKYQSA